MERKKMEPTDVLNARYATKKGLVAKADEEILQWPETRTDHLGES